MRAALRDLADPKIAAHSARFFRSGKGEYGEGDCFLGIRVPVVRKQVREFRDAPLRAVKAMLRSSYHELAVSRSLWDRRIAMMATYHYIKQGVYSDTLCIAGLLRYAIEKFPETPRRAYLDGTI